MASQKKPFFQPYFVRKTKTSQARSYFKWKKFDALIQAAETKDGAREVYYAKTNIKAPAHWSQTAVDIAASKYFRRSVKKESSIEALIERIGLGLGAAASSSELFKSTNEVKEFAEELKYILYSQMAAFNSPVWFNVGLKEAYKLSSKSDHYALNFKSKKIEKVTDAYLRPQSSACFIQSVEDSIESIFELVKTEAKLFKYGSGSGTNFSTLRSKHEELSTGGSSSGLISFLEVLDKSAGAIKSGGTTRRAAKMVCLDLDHPEVEDFIAWKMKEEKKALALVAEGYSSELDGEAYKTVSGQNANNSLRIPDRFMKKIGSSANWALRSRNSNKTLKTVGVDQLWKQICVAAWQCADPGLQFEDTINHYNTCSTTDVIRASNPCSEYMFLDDSACNLASINLVNFLDEQQNLKLDELIHVARTLFIAQECLVDFSSYPTAKIAQNSHDYRPLGLGFANLGSMLMRMGLAYDSDEARAWAGFLTAVISGVAYRTSSEMAEQRGAFAGFKKNKICMLAVIKKHQNSVAKIDWSKLPKGFSAAAKTIWDETYKNGKLHGFRNAQATVIAPTGTIGLVMDCDTTGIEPDFSLVKNKKLAGGGSIKIVNQSVEAVLRKLKYSIVEIKKIKLQLLEKSSIISSSIKKEHLALFACATGDLALSPEAHLKMMAAVQPFISGAISKTVNLPAESTVEDVSRTYQTAWKLGLKSVAIYRDGSKFVQPLSSPSSSPSYPLCSECGHQTILESGCYRCTNCGTTSACAS